VFASNRAGPVGLGQLYAIKLDGSDACVLRSPLIYVYPRIDCCSLGERIALIKANLAKARDAKPRVLASSATFFRHEGPQDRRAARPRF
jgi:hypothetical protein